ncbi:MAG TPA: twin-arginine translocase subunit TatC [Bacillota bacterium]|nr:twin-arginine translocase subunit TatC [Bacillota bacterium]
MDRFISSYIKNQDIPWAEHLGELRKRIIYCLIFFILAMIFGFVFSKDIVSFLKQGPGASQIDWHVFGIPEALSVYIKVSVIIGLIVSFPFFLYQIWAFAKPGLKRNEQRLALQFIPAATFLFLLGISFSYFILFPMLLKFMIGLTTSLQAEEMFGITQFFSFLFTIILPFGVLFELPIIVVFLTRIGVLNPFVLTKARKIAYFVLVIIACVITPPEFISEILVSIPLLLLYEFSIWLSKRAYRKYTVENEEIHKS